MYTSAEYIDALRNCYLFDGIAQSDMDNVIKSLNGKIKKYKKNEFILCIDDAIAYAGVLIKGNIESSFQNENYDQITMRYFSEGYVFGEALILNEIKSSPVQIRAVEDCTVLFIDLKLIYKSDNNSGLACPFRAKLAENLIKSLAKKNWFLNQKVRILSQKSLRDRILIYFGTLKKDIDGFITLPISQTAMAEYIGVNRSALSREIGRMQNENIIQMRNGKIKIL